MGVAAAVAATAWVLHVYTGTAWVLHMGPWLASMGPAHGPLAWVLHKAPGEGLRALGQGPGLQTLHLMRLMDMHHVIELHAFRLDQLKTRSPS